MKVLVAGFLVYGLLWQINSFVKGIQGEYLLSAMSCCAGTLLWMLSAQLSKWIESDVLRGTLKESEARAHDLEDEIDEELMRRAQK